MYFERLYPSSHSFEFSRGQGLNTTLLLGSKVLLVFLNVNSNTALLCLFQVPPSRLSHFGEIIL